MHHKWPRQDSRQRSWWPLRELAQVRRSSRSPNAKGKGQNGIMDQSDSISSDSGEGSGKKRVTTYCCVPQCNNYASEGLSFHKFPSNIDLKRRWETALKMGKPSSSSMRVCSAHFLKSDYFPSGN